jgi:hypothetical protein
LVAEQLVDDEARENRGHGLIRYGPRSPGCETAIAARQLKVERHRRDAPAGWRQRLGPGRHDASDDDCVDGPRSTAPAGRWRAMRSHRWLGICGGCGWRWLCRPAACSGHPSSAWVVPWEEPPIFGTNLIAFGFAQGRPPL